MALTKCGECGNDVSTEAKTCPKCGAKVKQPKKPMSTAMKAILILLFGSIVISVAVSTPGNKVQQESSPAQKAAESKRDTQLQIAGMGALSLKRSMKDPEAFDLESLVVMPDGSACYEYRAKNGFGATFPGSAVLTAKGKMLVKEHDGNVFVNAWNKACTKPGGDEISGLLRRQGIL